MTRKTFDVIYSVEDNELPTILEVVDTDNVAYTLERLRYYEKHYSNVQIAFGISVNKEVII